jgi:hypothetical protein
MANGTQLSMSEFTYRVRAKQYAISALFRLANPLFNLNSMKHNHSRGKTNQ